MADDIIVDVCTDRRDTVVDANTERPGHPRVCAGGQTGAYSTFEIVETVTGAPGSAAKAENLGTKTAVKLKLTIPQGMTGVGKPGPKGDPGYTPQKNVDYFDGVTPVKGVDYFTPEEKAEMVEEVIESTNVKTYADAAAASAEASAKDASAASESAKDASDSKAAAANSEAAAKNSATEAEASAKAASDAKVGVQTAEGNAAASAQAAKASESASKAAQAAAEKARDEAQQAAGGDFATPAYVDNKFAEAKAYTDEAVKDAGKVQSVNGMVGDVTIPDFVAGGSVLSGLSGVAKTAWSAMPYGKYGTNSTYQTGVVNTNLNSGTDHWNVSNATLDMTVRFAEGVKTAPTQIAMNLGTGYGVPTVEILYMGDDGALVSQGTLEGVTVNNALKYYDINAEGIAANLWVVRLTPTNKWINLRAFGMSATVTGLMTGEAYDKMLTEVDERIEAATPTVPTKTSELENDSGFITAADVPTPESDVFYAVFGTTTTAELEAALTAGKAVYCKSGAYVARFLRKNAAATRHVFGYRDTEYLCDSDTWSTSVVKFSPASHAETHAADGSDPITPAAIGAVSKNGDTMTGPLTITEGNPLRFATGDIGVYIAGSIGADGTPYLTVLDTENDSPVCIRDVATPTEDNDAANKQYVDNAVANAGGGGNISFAEDAPSAADMEDGEVRFVGSIDSGVELLEYIEGEANQYFYTGFIPNQDTRVVIDLQMTSTATSSGTSWFYNAREAVRSKTFGAFFYTQTTFGGDYGATQNTAILTPSDPLARIVIDHNKNVIKFGDTSYTFSAATFTSPCELVIFAKHTAGTIAEPPYAKLYSCKVYDNGTLIRDYVPARKDGVAGVYDRVNATFTRSASGTDFIAGTATGEYVGCTGDAYFKNDGTIFKVGGATDDGNDNAAAFGTRGPVIIQTTQTLDLSQYGLKVGDKVNVICIGGGGGGGTGYANGGAAGNGGTAVGGGGGGAGGGYGAGGGGCGGYDGSGTNYYAGGGGGSGYLNAKTVTLTSTSVTVTIGAAGAAGTAYNKVAGSGGTTSFGSYLSASGGGGAGSTSSPYCRKAGVGARNGGTAGEVGTYTNKYGGGGGGGAGGWLVESFTVYSATDGEDGEYGASTSGGLSNGYYGGLGGKGGSDGYDGGARGVNGKSNPLGGKGAVIFWY